MELSLLNIGYSRPDARWNWKDVRSPFARIYYVVEGEALTRFGGSEYRLVPGRLYLTPPFTLHEDESRGPFSLYYIHFFDEPAGRESVFDSYDFPVEAAARTSDAEMIERLLELNPGRHLPDIDPLRYDNMPSFRRCADYNRRLPLHVLAETRAILSILLSRFIEDASPKPASRDRRILESLAYIHQNIDSELSVSAIASAACLSTDHFIRLFRHSTGHTPLGYIHKKKIERAQLLLLTTEMAVKEVAFELSIDNISYFNRLFKRLTGKTPGRYRAEAAAWH